MKCVHLAVELDPKNGSRDRILYASGDLQKVRDYELDHMLGMKRAITTIWLDRDYNDGRE